MKLTTEQLADEIEALRAKARADALLIESQKREIEYLAQQVAYFKATKYAPKSESMHPGQGSLFNEAEADSGDPADEVEFQWGPDSGTDQDKARRKPKRKPLPDSLKRVEEIIDLPDEKKHCVHTGAALRRVGEEVSERLDIVPAVVQVIRTVRIKYACSCGYDDCKFHVAPPAPQPIPKSNASAGLLAYVACGKYSDHCPLYRQEELLQRMGCDLPRSTLSNWMIRCGNLVTPLINLIREKILEGPLVFCDETPLQVLKGTKKKPTSKCFMWVQAKWGGIGERYVLYNFDITRKSAVALGLFQGYQGYVQADGYEGYSALNEVPGITLVGDWVHVRRKFNDVKKASETSAKAQLADQALEYIAGIYKIEKDIAEFSAEEKLSTRQQRTKPLVMAFKAWADEQTNKVPPKSLIGKAFAYFQGQWPKLQYFLDDPVVGPDTNLVENVIRPFAVGRKNWLFSDTVRGAEASANIFSLVITAKSNGIDPYEYLKAVFEALPKATSAEDIAALLPDAFLKSRSAIH